MKKSKPSIDEDLDMLSGGVYFSSGDPDNPETWGLPKPKINLRAVAVLADKILKEEGRLLTDAEVSQFIIDS